LLKNPSDNCVWPLKGPDLWCRSSSGIDLCLLLGLLGQEHGLDVRQHTSLSDGHAGEQLVELLVVADGQLQVTGDDPRLLVVASGVAGQLEDLSSQVLHDGGQVHGGTGTDALGVVALAEQTVDTTHGELESRTAGASLGLALHLSSFAATRHDLSRVRVRRANSNTDLQSNLVSRELEPR